VVYKVMRKYGDPSIVDVYDLVNLRNAPSFREIVATTHLRKATQSMHTPLAGSLLVLQGRG
jgi:hypothetical protein